MHLSLSAKSRALVGALTVALVIAGAAARAQVTKESVPGVTNFSRIGTTIACAGATTPAAVAEIKKLGYHSIINLRQASENGADLDAEAAAAKAAGINYVHLPLNSATPDPAVVPQFIAAVSAPANQPAFVHCASANRASALWLIKRVQVDGWEFDRAAAEATDLGLTSPALKTFARDYIAAHPR
jgi:uncharacterized protein (TIGR01244 family)